MSLALIKKKFKKGTKSHIFIVGSIGSGKSSLLKSLQQKLSMIDKGTQNMAGITLESIKSNSEEIFAYNYNKSSFKPMMKFLQQSTTKCVIFIIDSRKQHIISDSKGNDIRSAIKNIAKIISDQCHVLILCNKQDITDQEVLHPDEITKILDIDRTFQVNTHKVIGCSLNKDNDIDDIISYLTETNILKPTHSEEEETKTSDTRTRKKSFKDVFKRSSPRKKTKQKELILIFGLDKVGKTALIDSFEFGKKSKTNIAIFEAETIKCKHVSTTEFHAWNYNQKSWAMAKSFFINCSLVIFVIDGTKYDSLKSDKRNVLSVDAYLKKLLGIDVNARRNSMFNRVAMDNPLMKKSLSADVNKEVDNELWPLRCPFLFYINKCDLEEQLMIEDDLEKELQISRLMKSKGIKYFVQQCSTKTKKGIYDGLMWCYSNGILTDIPEIADYAHKNGIEVPLNVDLQKVAPTQLKKAQTK